MPILKLYDGSGWVEIPILDGVPGGELGGTWAAPTVDATHAGSKHPADILTTRGDLIRRGASEPERFAAVTAGAIVGGNGTDVVATVPKRSIIIRAEGLRPNTTDPCADAVQAETGTGGKNYVTRSFAANEQGSMDMFLPENYDGGTVTWWYSWISPSGSSAGDTVIFSLRGSSTQNGDAIGEAQGSPVTITDTLLTGTDRYHKSDESSALTIAGSPSGGDLVIWEIERTGGTMAEEAPLLTVYIRYGTNNVSDE
jgi:hypothetical protein